MDIRDRFLDAWKRRYPDSDCPNLGCFETTSRGVELGAYEKLSYESKESLARIHKLRDELDKEEFIYHFLLSQLDLYQVCDRKSNTSLFNFGSNGNGAFRTRANSGSARTSLSTSSLPQPSRFVRVGSESEARGRSLRSADKFRAPNRILSCRLSRSPDSVYQNSQKLHTFDIENGNNIHSHEADNISLRHDIVNTEKSSICYVKPTVSRSSNNDLTSYVDKCIVAESGTALTVSIEGGADIKDNARTNYVMDRLSKGNNGISTTAGSGEKVAQVKTVTTPSPGNVREPTTPEGSETERRQSGIMKDSGSVKSRPVPKPKPSMKGPAVRSRGASSSSMAPLSPHIDSNSAFAQERDTGVSANVSATSSNITLKSIPQHIPVSQNHENEAHIVIISKNESGSGQMGGKQTVTKTHEEVGGGLIKTSPNNFANKQLTAGNSQSLSHSKLMHSENRSAASNSLGDRLNTIAHQENYVNINIKQVQKKYGVPENWDAIDGCVPHSLEMLSKHKAETVGVNSSSKMGESDGTSVDSGIGHCISNVPVDVENIEEDISPYGTTFASGARCRMPIQPQNSNVHTTNNSGASNSNNKTVFSTFGKTSPTTEPSVDALYSNSSIPDRKKTKQALARRVHNYEEINIDAVIMERGQSVSNSPVCSPAPTAKEVIYAEPTPVMRGQKNEDTVKPLSPFSKQTSLKKNLPGSPLAKHHSFDSRHDSDDGESYNKPRPGNKKTAQQESSSSDEEEPIYYNLLLLQKETLKKQQTLRKTVIDDAAIYQSIDLQKKVRDRELRKLQDQKEDGNKTDLSPASFYCRIPEGTNTSTVEGEESRDSVFLRQDSLPQSPLQASTHMVKENPEWRKRQSMLMATHDRGSETSLESLDMPSLELPVSNTSADHADKQHIRKCVVMGILDSENMYVDCLDVLLQYMRSLQAAAKSSQPVISMEDVSIIFFKIPALYDLHMEFVRKLEPVVEMWNKVNADQSVGVIFKEMAVQLPIAGEYISNYPKAIATVKKCSQNSVQFQELTMAIKTKGLNETLSLEELLHKPLVRVQRNSLVLHDLIKCTATAHTDYDMLQKALKITQYFLENLTLPQYEGIDKEFQRYLVKNSLIVELSGSKRRLRHVFLYNDLLVCSKQRVTRQKFHYDVKWFIPIPDLKLDMSSESVDGKLYNTDEVDSLRKRLKTTAETLRKEVSRQKKMEEQNKDKNWMFRNNSKNIDKLKKKLAELEGQLVLASPSLKLCILDGAERRITFLMSSDYERNEWRDTIQVLQAKRPVCPTLSLDEVTAQINGCKQLPKMNNLGSFFRKDDTALEDEILNGVLTVTIHRLHGLREACDIFCCMEVDSYGQFSIKAKTNLICGTTEPTWNEGFEIDLESSQTLRLMCYKREYEKDVVLGKCALELNRAWLRGEFTEKIITLNEEMSLTVSLSFISREQTLRRMPSSVKTGVFGVPIRHLTKRENSRIPLIVLTCVEEIEKRGLDEVGIYRLSGLSSEIQRLKKAFDKSSKAAAHLVREVDVNVATGLLKLYFRELPEALFTDRLYHSFVDGMELADPEAKQNCMLTLFKSLPEPSHRTALYLMSHLFKVSESSFINKMNLNNLSTVFGPTLLRPASKNDPQPSGVDFFAGAQDAHMQSTILLYFLTLYSKGCNFEVVTSAF